MKRVLFFCLLGSGLLVLGLAAYFLWQALRVSAPNPDRAINFTPENLDEGESLAVPAIETPEPPARIDANDSPQPLAGESPNPPLRPGIAPRVGPGIDPPVLEAATRFLSALNAGDETAALALMTGYETAAARMRQAALAEGDFLSRQDLSAQQRLAVLALRDIYTRNEIGALETEQVILTRPGDDPMLPVPQIPIQLGSLRLDEQGFPSLRLVLGTQERVLRLRSAQSGWRVQADFLFDPSRLTPRDAEILTQVGEKGGGDRAWLEIYAAMAGSEPDPNLLKPPA